MELVPFIDIDSNADNIRGEKTLETLTEVFAYLIEKELTKRQKEIVKLYLCKGKKQCEISEMLNISQPTISHVLHTAMDKLQKYMFYCEKALNVYCDLQIREVLK